MCVTFVTLECVRARVWLLPSLRSVGACVWPWLPERVVVYIFRVYSITTRDGRRSVARTRARARARPDAHLRELSMPHSDQRVGASCAHRLSFFPSRRRTLKVKAASALAVRATMSCPPRTRSTTRGPSCGTLPLLLLAAWLRVCCGLDGSAGESGTLTYQTRSGTPKTSYQRITVTSGDSPSTVKWSLDCEGLVDPVVGGAPFDGMIAMPPGECYLTMTDTHCAGWNGAEWSAPGWTDESYSASASELRHRPADAYQPTATQPMPELLCAKRVSFRIAESLSLPLLWPPPLPPSAPELHREHNSLMHGTDHSALANGGGEGPPPALWMLRGPLGMLLVAVLVAFCQHYYRLTQNEANLRASRDRAHFDLQLIVHRVTGDRCDNDLFSQPDSRLDKPCVPVPLACASAASGCPSLPPGPPSSPAASVSGAPAASLPRGPPSISAEVPLSWAEADRQFYASPAGKAYLAANPAHPAECSTSRPSRAPAAFATHSAQLRRGVDVAFGRDPASAPAPSALPPPARPHRASSATTKKPRPMEGPAPRTRSLLKASKNSLQRCGLGKALPLRWESLTDCERERHLLEAALRSAVNIEPPSPAPAPASLPTAALGTELVELACAEASTAPLTSASTPEHPGLPLTTTAGPEVRLVDLMGLAELQDDQAEAALSNALFDDTPPRL